MRLLFGSMLGLTLATASIPAIARGNPPRPAPPASSFSLPIRGPVGSTVTLDSLRGHVVLVDFWASWCEPCRQSFAWMSEINNQYGPHGLRIVAINLDKTRPPAEAFLAQHPAPFTIAWDPEGKTAKAFKVSTLPMSFLVSPQGTLVYTHPGFDPKKTGEIESLIKESCTP